MTPEDKIKEARHILGMIENVDVDDVETHDEIDARVWCLINGHEFGRYYVGSHKGMKEINIYIKGHKYRNEFGNYYELENISYLKSYVPYARVNVFYTTSRDALKSIRPDGWNGKIEFFPTGGGAPHVYCTFWKVPYYKTRAQTRNERSPTEELAELHAILQAYIWEWGVKR